jgi:GAF domain-containing protein
MTGWCIENATARIALDVGDDAVRFDNPYLPKTHSEVALPLRSRGKVLGALTVQSTEVAAFDTDIMATLQTMTDQIDTSLANAELFAQNEAALEAERKAYGEFSYQAWLALTKNQGTARYISDAPGKVQVATEPVGEEQTKAASGTVQIVDNGLTAILPIKSRDAILGGVRLKKPDASGRWTRSQIEMAENIAEQLSVALESARLFEESQRRAAREHLIGEASTRMRETLDIESVLETAAQELHRILGKVETEVWLDPETSNAE